MRKSQGRQKRSKGPGRPEILSVEEVVAALRKSRGIQRYAARALGCDRHTIANMAKRHPEVRAVVEEEIEGLVDSAEAKLIEAINNRELGAIIFFLKCRGKHRGYVERSEHTGKDGKDIFPAVDTTKLDNDELAMLERLLRKATGTEAERSNSAERLQ